MTLSWHNCVSKCDLFKWNCEETYLFLTMFRLKSLFHCILFHWSSCVNQEHRKLFHNNMQNVIDTACQRWFHWWESRLQWQIESWGVANSENTWLNGPNKLWYSVCSTIRALISLPWHPFKRRLKSSTGQVCSEECGARVSMAVWRRLCVCVLVCKAQAFRS